MSAGSSESQSPELANRSVPPRTSDGLCTPPGGGAAVGGAVLVAGVIGPPQADRMIDATVPRPMPTRRDRVVLTGRPPGTSHLGFLPTLERSFALGQMHPASGRREPHSWRFTPARPTPIPGWGSAAAASGPGSAYG